MCQAAEKLQCVRVNLPYLTLHVVQFNYCTWANCNVELKQSVWGKLLLKSNALHITRYLYLKVISYFIILEYVQTTFALFSPKYLLKYDCEKIKEGNVL